MEFGRVIGGNRSSDRTPSGGCVRVDAPDGRNPDAPLFSAVFLWKKSSTSVESEDFSVLANYFFIYCEV